MGTGVHPVSAGQSDTPHCPANRRFRSPRQEVCPCTSGSRHSASFKRLSTRPYRSRPLHAMAHGHSGPRHFRAISSRRICIRLDTELRSSIDHYLGQGKPILLCHLSAIDANLGHRGDHDNAISPRGQRNGGAIPQTAEGVFNRSRKRRARQVVLEAANGPLSYPHHRQAGYRRISFGPRLRRRPGRPWRSTPKRSSSGSSTRPSTRVHTRQPEIRSRETTADGDLGPQATPSASSGRLATLLACFCQERRRPGVTCLPLHRSVPCGNSKQSQFQDRDSWPA